MRSVTLRALAEQLAADPPYVTLMVDDLEGRGLVQRTPHPEDRRAKLVELTAAGRVAAARAEAILDEPPAALHDVPTKDLAAMLRVLERLADRSRYSRRPGATPQPTRSSSASDRRSAPAPHWRS